MRRVPALIPGAALINSLLIQTPQFGDQIHQSAHAFASAKHADDRRRVHHDILWMSQALVVQPWQGGHLFHLKITGSSRNRLYTLKVIFDPATDRPPSE
jgi:hypothetical protein